MCELLHTSVGCKKMKRGGGAAEYRRLNRGLGLALPGPCPGRQCRLLLTGALSYRAGSSILISSTIFLSCWRSRAPPAPSAPRTSSSAGAGVWRARPSCAAGVDRAGEQTRFYGPDGGCPTRPTGLGMLEISEAGSAWPSTAAPDRGLGRPIAGRGRARIRGLQD